MNSTFQRVALIGKYKSPEIAPHLLRLAQFLRGRGVEVVVDMDSAPMLGESGLEALQLKEIGVRADLAVVIGGDGTMLNIARTLAPYGVALVGVNQGRLGFLTDLSVQTMLESIGAMLDGHFITEARMLLQADLRRDKDLLYDEAAFNDVAVNKGADGAMMDLEVRIDGLFVYRLRSDGLIIASPTGSTAYALSSGGPILHPGLEAITLVPVSPHTLSNRPIVVSAASRVEVHVHRAFNARSHFDAHSYMELQEGDILTVRRCRHDVRLLHPVGHDYYHTLREKLHWSEAL
jgi:NAD+ kinase